MSLFFNQSKPRAVLLIQGEDAQNYLQSQWTIDLEKLLPGEVRFGLRLNTKGKVMAGAYFFKKNTESLRLLSRGTEAGEMIDLLEQNVVADEIEFIDETKEWNLLTIFGSEAEKFLISQNQKIPTYDKFLNSDGNLAFLDSRLPENSFSILMNSKFQESINFTDWKREDRNEFEKRRIKGGFVLIPEEIGPDDLPHEGKLEKSCVDFEKGCYLGQEVMARLHAMGKVRKHTHSVVFTGPHAPSLPANLFLNNKPVGVLKSLQKDNDRYIGIALVHEKAEEALHSEGLRMNDVNGGVIRKLEDEK